MPSPRYAGRALPLPDAIRAEMIGVSHHAELGGPTLDALALLRMSHWGFDGAVHEGELVVAAAVADDVLGAFARIFEARFPIEQMRRIEAFGGDDLASMRANNSSAYNCRRIIASERLSVHSFGRAVDINPMQNPVVRDGRVRPPEAAPFVERDAGRPGTIVRPGPVVDAFDAIGWEWGGDWTSLKDYHHFQRA